MLIAARSWKFFLIAYVFSFSAAFGQQVNLSLKDALKRVEANLPQLEAYRQQALASKENIALAKNSMVPEMNAGYQLNSATFNNITGMSYPGFLLPISGPPSPTNEMNFVPGSALGTIVKWNPFTFGQRNAAVEKATAAFKEANALYNEQLFRYQYSTLNVYLDAVYATQVMNTIKAGIDRNKAGLGQSLVLASAGLKQGIDTVQFQAAITQGEIDLLETEKVYIDKMTSLRNLTGIPEDTGKITLTDTAFSAQLQLSTDTANHLTHPLYQTISTRQATTAAELKQLQKLFAPQLDIWGNVYTRASGVDATGNINKADGFQFSRTNAGIGLQLNFPVLQFSKINIQKRQYNLLLKAGEASLQQADRDISTQTQAAIQQYEKDVQITDKTPALLKASRDVYQGLSISYEHGLIDYTRLEQAQYDLVKAELNNANAHLQLWRSLLRVAIAKGNLDIFLSQLK